MNQERVELGVSGMTCDACAAHMRQALEEVPGVQTVALPGWREGRATIVADASLSDETLTEAVAAAGYGARVLSRSAMAEQAGAVRPGEAEVDLMIVGAGAAASAAMTHPRVPHRHPLPLPDPGGGVETGGPELREGYCSTLMLCWLSQKLQLHSPEN